jgi:hypothetical protein
MEIGMHPRVVRGNDVNRWRVWIRDSAGVQGFDVPTYSDAYHLKNELSMLFAPAPKGSQS